MYTVQLFKGLYNIAFKRQNMYFSYPYLLVL